MELLFIIIQEADFAKLADDFIANRVVATKFETEGLYLHKKNITLMACIEKSREEEVFGYIKKNCTERMELCEAMEYNGSFMESVTKQVKIGGATVIIMEIDRKLQF